MNSTLMDKTRGHTMKSFLGCVALAAGMLLGTFSHGEIMVVVHPSNAALFDKNAIQRIFLGKTRAFPGGEEALPLSLRETTVASADFTRSVLAKTPKQLKSYWAKMVFTGKGTPPKQMDSSKQIIDLVSNNPNFIGFVKAGTDNGGVKVVGRF